MNKRKILKVIGGIAIIILIMLIAYFTRNFIIINKLAKAQHEFFSSTNYLYCMQNNSEENVSFEYYYYKDGKTKEVLKDKEGIIWITWYNKDTQEKIWVHPNQLTAEIITSQGSEMNPITNMLLSSLLPNNLIDKMTRATTFFITTEEIDGEKCYVLQPLTGIISNTYYFNKETGMITKCMMGDTKIELKELKANVVNDEDIVKPNLTEYEVTNNK